MSEVYSIQINKGGVGKTSLVTNMATILSQTHGKKVLIIETDGQGNAGMSFGLAPKDYELTIYDVLVGQNDINEVIINIYDNLDIIIANEDMNYISFDILLNTEQYNRPLELLKPSLDKIKDKYDYIIIDTPPSWSLVAGNVLTATEKVIVPFVPEEFCIHGLIRVLNSIKVFQDSINPDLQLFGIIGTMVDNRTTLHTEMMQQARKICHEKGIYFFDTVIPKSIRFANAVAYDHKPAVLTDQNNKLVRSYYELINEFLEVAKNGKK